MSRWKAIERYYCRELGGDRTGPTGRDDCDCKDTDPFGVEIKHGAAAPISKTLQACMQQAIDNAGDRIPLLILHPKGWRMQDTWVCMPWGAWMRYMTHGK